MKSKATTALKDGGQSAIQSACCQMSGTNNMELDSSVFLNLHTKKIKATQFPSNTHVAKALVIILCEFAVSETAVRVKATHDASNEFQNTNIVLAK
jgi:hypothetical protein